MVSNLLVSLINSGVHPLDICAGLHGAFGDEDVCDDWDRDLSEKLFRHLDKIIKLVGKLELK